MSKNVLVTMKSDKDLRRIIQDRLGGRAGVIYLEDLAAADREETFKSADVLMFFRLLEEIAPREIALLENLSLLQSVPAGVETLPFKDLPSKMTICANAGAWSAPLAEYIVGLMIALNRELVAHRRKLARGEYDRVNSRYLRGRVLGIVGFGGIGLAAARLVRPMGLRIMALNSRGRTDEAVEFIGTLADLDHLLQLADVVLLAAPLTKRTRGLIGARELNLMKDDAILINVARGAIVDEDALYEHLKTHPDFKFGADVWWREPLTGSEFSLKHPLFDFPNVLGTPHNADHVEGMQSEATAAAAENVGDFLEGRPIRGVVDRSDYL
ncbi:MAG: 2-hydroxyacid dehydrogenase [Thermodesulfobacteriota bacterium]